MSLLGKSADICSKQVIYIHSPHDPSGLKGGGGLDVAFRSYGYMGFRTTII